MRSISLQNWTLSTVLVAALAATGPAPAIAQLAPEVQSGSRLVVKPKELEAERLGRVVKDFARCIYGRKSKIASTLLMNSDSFSINYEGAGIKPEGFNKAFGMEACLGLQANYDENAIALRLSAVSLRALMAEEDYLARFSGPPALPVNAEETLDRTFTSSAAALTRAKAYGAFGDCVVFQDLARADALMRTVPGAASEKDAARAMAPALGACLLEGETISLTPTSIRMIMADALWARFVRSGSKAAVVD